MATCGVSHGVISRPFWPLLEGELHRLDHCKRENRFQMSVGPRWPSERNSLHALSATPASIPRDARSGEAR